MLAPSLARWSLRSTEAKLELTRAARDALALVLHRDTQGLTQILSDHPKLMEAVFFRNGSPLGQELGLLAHVVIEQGWLEALPILAGAGDRFDRIALLDGPVEAPRFKNGRALEGSLRFSALETAILNLDQTAAELMIDGGGWPHVLKENLRSPGDVLTISNPDGDPRRCAIARRLMMSGLDPWGPTTGWTAGSNHLWAEALKNGHFDVALTFLASDASDLQRFPAQTWDLWLDGLRVLIHPALGPNHDAPWLAAQQCALQWVSVGLGTPPLLSMVRIAPQTQAEQKSSRRYENLMRFVLEHPSFSFGTRELNEAARVANQRQPGVVAAMIERRMFSNGTDLPYEPHGRSVRL